MEFVTKEARIAYLEARVAALEAALEARSRELRKLQRHLLPEDLALLARLASGLPPLPRQAFELSLWTETTEMSPADVEETLKDLWRSLRPVREPGEEDGDGTA